MRFELAEHHKLWAGLKVEHSDLYADLFTNLIYMPALEDGHSKQAPQGMVDINLANIARQFDRAASQAASAIVGGADPDRALVGAVNNAALFALREIVVDTPIDTGRARASWQLRLADGAEHDSASLGLTPPVGSRGASRDASRARAGKRGIRRKFDLGGDA